MKNRFVIFAGDNYYPPQNSIISGHETLEEAISKISKGNKYKDDDGTEWGGEGIRIEGQKYGYDWCYVIDITTLKEVWRDFSS